MNQTTSKPSWLRVILNRRMLICIFTGFASGLPLYLLFNLIPAWLKTEGVSLKVIGVFALAQFPFTWKFLWAPLLDRYNIVSWLGRRRGWMFVTQVGLIASIAWLGQTPVVEQPLPLPGFFKEMFGLGGFTFPWLAFVLATVIALLSATQDIALDAFRREILPDAELGLGNAIHVNAYRIAGLIPGSLSLILADRLPWGWVFAITAAFMIPGLVMTLCVREPAEAKGTPRTLHAAVVEPFREFFGRHGVQSALLVLAFLFLYKLGDSLCTALATPFYLDMGFSMTEIGIIAKNAGLWPSVIGGILGGIWMIRLGINRALWLFGVVQVVSILGFAWLAWQGPPYFEPGHARMEPGELVRTVTRDVLANACANREALGGDPKNARTLINNMARQHFDFAHMARLAVGPGWEQATKEQHKGLADGFHMMFVHRYATAIVQHCDWRVEVEALDFAPNADEVMVIAAMHRPDAPASEAALNIGYSLKITPKGWKVFDMAVEGKSLAQGYREDFAARIQAEDGGGVKGLIDWLRGQVKSDFWALVALALVIGIEAMGVGLGSAAFVAYMARTTHPAYTATQLALFTSLMAVPRTLVNASAGWLVAGMGGWLNFFWLCFFLAIPGMLLLFKVAPWNEQPPASPPNDS